MKRILLVPGDGIGPEVMAAGRDLIEALGKKYSLWWALTEVDWGAERWLREGIGLPDGVLEELPNKYDAILFGALGDKRIPDMAHGRAILLKLRFGLDLYINMRPVKLFGPSLCPLKDGAPSSVNMVIFRENTEDIYLGLGEVIHAGSANEIAIDFSRHTFYGIERLVKAAFDYAVKHGRKRVTLVDKSNAIKFGGNLWQRVFFQVAEIYPSISVDHLYVDVAAMQMVQNPARFDVIVTTNLFGDILSDLGAGIAGGLGLAPSANINPGVIAMFEPVHGSAPDLVGKNLANPFAMFLSIAMMLDYFGHHHLSALIEGAITAAIETKATTPDLNGTLTTTAAAEGIIDRIQH